MSGYSFNNDLNNKNNSELEKTARFVSTFEWALALSGWLWPRYADVRGWVTLGYVWSEVGGVGGCTVRRRHATRPERHTANKSQTICYVAFKQYFIYYETQKERKSPRDSIIYLGCPRSPVSFVLFQESSKLAR